MRLWRLSARATFDGEGARRYGGRWNRPGTSVIYAAATLALATLEFLAHLQRGRSPAAVFAHYADVPEDAAIDRLSEGRLPPGWRTYPAPDALRDVGTRWALSGTSVALSVPSAILGVPPQLITAERNFLLNPAHADFRRVRSRALRLELDTRLWK